MLREEPNSLRNILGRFTGHPATAWVVLVFALLVTLLVWFSADRFITRRSQDRFLFQSKQVHTMLLHRVDRYESALRGGVGLFAASQSVDREEWQHYVRSLNLDRAYAGMQGMGYAQVLPATEQERHETMVRAQGLADYRVWPQPASDTVVPIVYLEPAGSQVVLHRLGYDLASAATLREAMVRAAEGGVMALSGLVHMASATKEKGHGEVFMLLPVYGNKLPTGSVAERRAALRGFVFTVVRVADFLADGPAFFRGGLDSHLFDGLPPGPGNELHEAYPESEGEFDFPAKHALYDHSVELNVGGRTWLLYTHTTRYFISNEEAVIPVVVTVGSLLADLLLFFFVRSLATRQRRTIALAHRMTESLRNSEAGFRTLVECAPVAIVVINEKGVIENYNPAAGQLFGYGSGELLGKNVSVLMPNPYQDAHDAYLARYLGGGVPHIIGRGREVLGLHKDGRELAIHLTVGEQRLADGSRHFIGFINDVTERRQVEVTLRDRQSLLQSVIDTTVDGFWITDLAGRILEVNDVYCWMSGYSREELLTKEICDLDADITPERLAQGIAKVVKEGSDFFETRHLTKEGESWPVEVSLSYDPQQGGRLIGFHRNIAQRKRYEQELETHRHHLEDLVTARTAQLQAEEQRTRQILEFTADGIYGLDAEGRFTFANPAACRLLGRTQEELIGQPAHDLIHHSHPDGSPFPAEDCPSLGHLLSGEVVRKEHDVYWRADRSPLNVAMAGQGIRHEGVVVGAVVSFTDIGERLVAESAMRQHSEELRAKNETLEKFNRIVVGRELDMIRMKRRINELSIQLGQTPPYDLSFADAVSSGGKPAC